MESELQSQLLVDTRSWPELESESDCAEEGELEPERMMNLEICYIQTETNRIEFKVKSE